MNNTTLGTDTWTYYETIGGGQGASPHADGPSAVHVAMSNALNTPVEALELAYPLRVERYELRRGSGGAGAASGRRRGGPRASGTRAVPSVGARRPASSCAARRAWRWPGGARSHARERRGDPRQGHASAWRPATWCERKRRAAEALRSLGSAHVQEHQDAPQLRAARDERGDPAAALQYVRKVSGSTKPSKANEAVFQRAVDEIAHITAHLLEDSSPPRLRATGRSRLRELAPAPRSASAGCRVARPPPERSTGRVGP